MKLLTEFLTIATAGKTVDGRTISAEQLHEMTSNYDPSLYTAVVNYEHFGYNYGTVQSLRTSMNKSGEVILQAQIEPNAHMLSLNASGQKQFFSIEIITNFRDSKKAYLGGLALTDFPASVGTTQLKFSKEVGDKAFFSTDSEGQHLSFEQIKSNDGTIFSFIKNLFANNNNKETPKDSMTKEEKDAFCQSVRDDVKTIIAEAFATQVKNVAHPVVTQPTAITTASPIPTQAEFDALNDENERLKKELGELKSNEESTQFGKNLGNVATEEEIF